MVSSKLDKNDIVQKFSWRIVVVHAIDKIDQC